MLTGYFNGVFLELSSLVPLFAFCFLDVVPELLVGGVIFFFFESAISELTTYVCEVFSEAFRMIFHFFKLPNCFVELVSDRTAFVFGKIELDFQIFYL